MTFVATTAFWLYRMNRALALFEPLFIIPLLQVFWTFFATLNGGIYFREFMGDVFLRDDATGFSFGVLIIFIGVYFLAPSSGSSPTQQPTTAALGSPSKGISRLHSGELESGVDPDSELGNSSTSPQLAHRGSFVSVPGSLTPSNRPGGSGS